MTYECPKCNRYGMEWDGRAKLLICCYNTCNHVIRIQNQRDIPSDVTISEAIKKDSGEIRNKTPDKFIPA